MFLSSGLFLSRFSQVWHDTWVTILVENPLLALLVIMAVGCSSAGSGFRVPSRGAAVLFVGLVWPRSKPGSRSPR